MSKDLPAVDFVPGTFTGDFKASIYDALGLSPFDQPECAYAEIKRLQAVDTQHKALVEKMNSIGEA